MTSDQRIAGTLAAVAAIGLTHERNVGHRETSAERISTDIDHAFTMLRNLASTLTVISSMRSTALFMAPPLRIAAPG